MSGMIVSVFFIIYCRFYLLFNRNSPASIIVLQLLVI